LNRFPANPEEYSALSDSNAHFPDDPQFMESLLCGKEPPTKANVSKLMGFESMDMVAFAFEVAGDFDRALEFARYASIAPSFNVELNFLEGNSNYMSKFQGEMTMARLLCRVNRHAEAEHILKASAKEAKQARLPFFQVLVAKEAIIAGVPEARVKFDAAHLFAEMKGPPAVINRLLGDAALLPTPDGRIRRASGAVSENGSSVGHLVDGLQHNWRSHP
jgi:hypothetical protein